MHQKQTPKCCREKLTAAIRFIFSISDCVFHLCFSLLPFLIVHLVLSAPEKKRFNNFFPFRVKNRLRWISLLLLYLFQFLSHFYFYFDLMMLHLRSGMLELQLHDVVKAKCLHKSDSKTYVQCARITIERVLGMFVCVCMYVQRCFRISNCLHF